MAREAVRGSFVAIGEVAMLAGYDRLRVRSGWSRCRCRAERGECAVGSAVVCGLVLRAERDAQRASSVLMSQAGRAARVVELEVEVSSSHERDEEECSVSLGTSCL